MAPLARTSQGHPSPLPWPAPRRVTPSPLPWPAPALSGSRQLLVEHSSCRHTAGSDIIGHVAEEDGGMEEGRRDVGRWGRQFGRLQSNRDMYHAWDVRGCGGG